ncbi:hypothetical protein GCM10028803_20770 [Larkinella knui]|uniref:Outer membrane protein beta-barrel domain-containing protein n=1 Tax=Larkinella knui TaxID=2025310 RepID=A0A3P1CUY3_9BACT|nr:hypothetical protein [Larkinella knui]RRB17162.1 hypothetical protein EHT87_02455 [Larkinella knui]
MKKTFALLILWLVGLATAREANAQTNNWAVGFRIGEPAGVNVRKYFGTNHAFDLNVGTYGGIYGNRRSYRKGLYKNVGLSVQGHYLWHGSIGKSQTLHYYYGFGGQLNSRRYYSDRFSVVNAYDKTISVGGSGVAGLEYFLPNRPLSVFLETGAYVEVIPAPFFMGIQSGLGIRLNL